jgi:UDP-galactopyranose mutase
MAGISFHFPIFGFHIYHNPNTKISMFVNTLTLFGILQNSGLPWIEPKKALSFDFGSLTDTVNEVIGVCIFDLSICNCNIQC